MEPLPKQVPDYLNKLTLFNKELSTNHDKSATYVKIRAFFTTFSHADFYMASSDIKKEIAVLKQTLENQNQHELLEKVNEVSGLTLGTASRDLKKIIARDSTTTRAMRRVNKDWDSAAVENMIAHLNSGKPLSDLKLTKTALKEFLQKHGNNLKHFEIADLSREESMGLLGLCPNLNYLFIKNCKINNTDCETIVSKFPNLTSLDVGHNQIGPVGAESLSRLTNLTSLNVGSNQIGAAGAESLSRLTNLTSLNVTGNEIGDAGAESLSRLINLTMLNVFSNEIGDAGAESLSRLTNLTSLNVRDNRISPAGAGALSRLTNLTSLDVGHNQIGAAGAESLSRLTNLTSLDVGFNQIGDEGVEALSRALSRLTKLTSLDVGNNQIGDEGVEALSRALSHLTNLTSLNVGLYNKWIGYEYETVVKLREILKNCTVSYF